MIKQFVLMMASILLPYMGMAGQTATLVKSRRAASTSVVPGYWHASLSKCQSYARSHGVPLVAVWSNGDKCGHCLNFESACNNSTFKKWMKSSGCVFFFTHSGESGGSQGGTAYAFCEGGKGLRQFPFVRVYWYAGGVKKKDIAVTGDTVNGGFGGGTGASKAVAWIKKQIKGFSSSAPAVVKPYTIQFAGNGASNEMASVTAKVGTARTLPANTFVRPDYAFVGWARTADGSVVYKNKASVKNLTTVSNGFVTLYAKWTRTTYRTYDAGVKTTIAISDCKGWKVRSGSVAGMKWSPSTGKWTGTPTVAKTYTVKYRKGSSSRTRKVVVGPGVPYAITFAPNGGTNGMASVDARYGVARALPANTLVRPDYSFAGWAKTATGSVAYKNKASVKNLTAVSNHVVTLYAKWTRTIYRTYYTGVKATITISDCKGWTKTSGAISGMTWNASTGKWTGTPKTAGTYTTKYKKGSTKRTRKIVVVKDAVVFADENAARYVAAAGEHLNLNLAPASLAGPARTIAFSGLPAGLAYDAAMGCVTGTPERVGTFKVTVIVTSVNGQKLTRTFNFMIGVPDCCIGTFNGFIGWSDPEVSDPLYLNNRGTFRMFAPSNANLSAKIVTAKGTYTLSGLGWFANGDGTYTANLATADGGDALTFTAGGRMLSAAYLSCGVFEAPYGSVYEVWAQRSPFVRDASGGYVDPLVAGNVDKLIGDWHFKVAYDGSYGYDVWKFHFAAHDDADLTLRVSEDGSAMLTGKVGPHVVSASSTVFLFESDVAKGFASTGFAIPVLNESGKASEAKMLQIWLWLWFDKDNGDPRISGGERSVGNAYLEVFE